MREIIVKLNVLSSGLAEGSLGQTRCWGLASRGLLGDQSNTLLRWGNTDGLSINIISTIHLIPDPPYNIGIIGSSSYRTLSLTKPAYYNSISFLPLFENLQQILLKRFPVIRTFLECLLVKFKGSLENWLPPPVVRLTKKAFWDPK